MDNETKKHISILNREMGEVKTELKFINREICEVKDNIKKLDKRVWYILGSVLSGIAIQILFKVWGG